MTIRNELVALKDADGMIRPEKVVQWAKSNRRSRLHRSLTWDNDKAAHQYRIFQVRQLIAEHIIGVFNGSKMRQMVSLSIDRINPQGGYRDIDDVIRDLNLRQVLLQDAFDDFERARLKYQGLQQLAGVWRAVARAKRTSSKRRPRPSRGPKQPSRHGLARRTLRQAGRRKAG